MEKDTTINVVLEDINYIPGYIAAEAERKTNEEERISNENKRISNEQERINFQEERENKLKEVYDKFNNSLDEVKEELKEKLEEETAKEVTDEIKKEINALISNSPLVAASVEEMTDTTRVYVNTTDGNWYYYNGTNWVSGGVYQATQIADNTIVYNLINNLKYNLKDIFALAIRAYFATSVNEAAWARGERYLDNNNTYSCTNKIPLNIGTKILSNNENIKFKVVMYDEDLNFIGASDYVTEYVITEGVYFGLNIRSIDEESIKESISIYTNLETTEIINDDWKIGTQYVNGDYGYETNRLVSKNYFVNTGNLKVVTKEYIFAVIGYDENFLKNSTSAWLNLNDEYKIPEISKYYRFTAKKVDNSNIIDSDLTHIKECVSIIDETFEMNEEKYNECDFINSLNIEFSRIHNTSYLFARIPKITNDGKQIRPHVRLTTDDGALDNMNTRKSALTYSKNNRKIFTLNGGIYNINTNIPFGQTIIDGVSITNTPATNKSDGAALSEGEAYPLCFDNNGDLSANYDKFVDTQTMINDGIVNAITGWIKIVDNYVICENDISVTLHSSVRIPQQIIGQFQNGDYFVCTSDGQRGNVTNESGMTYTEMANLLISKGVKFAYALDGGGSAETVIKQRQLNPIYEQVEGRKIPAVICFEIGI